MIAEPVMEQSTNSKPYVPLRRWQERGITAFREWYANRKSGDSKSFVAAVSGGAGKTRFGAFIAHECEQHGINRVVVIAPSNTIAQQWLDVLHELGRDAILWDSTYSGKADIVITYSMVAFHSARLNKLINSHALLITDEFHHLAESATWGVIARNLGAKAAYRIMLSATVFREDEAKIPLVTYTDGRLQTNFEYSYGEALDDGYVRPVYFKALDANSQWKLDNNLANARLLDTETPESKMQFALNAALLPDSAFLKELIGMAHQQLQVLRSRENSANAAGIITCKDQHHARKVQRLVQKITHTNPVLSISDDSDSDAKLNHFRNSDDAWLVVVRKGSEGLDIPRLRVGVYATNILTELYFLQFLFRLVRQPQGHKEDAYLFMPAHPKLVEYAKGIREMRVHALKEVVDSPVGERVTSEKGESTVTTPIASEAGETVEINTYADLSPLEKLIKIRELAARTIDDIARGYDHHLQDAFHIQDTLDKIAALLGVQYTAPLVPATTEHTLAREFERKRQWLVFKKLFNQVQKLPSWYLGVLSLLHSIEGAMHGEHILKRVPEASKRVFGENRTKENQLIELGLIAYENKAYHCIAELHLLDICPDYDSEELMGYLLTGRLPEAL